MTNTKKPSKDGNGGSSAAARTSSGRAGQGAARDGDGNGAGGSATVRDFDGWARASQLSLVGLFIIAIIWCAYVAQHVIVPVVLAWVIATIVLPVVRWLQRRGIPRVVAVLVVTALLIALLGGLLTLLSTPLTYWVGRMTELVALVKEKLQTMNQPLALLEELRNSFDAISAGTQPSLKVEQPPTTFATVFSIAAPAISQLILFVGALIFYLIYQKKWRDSAVYFLKDRGARLTALRILTDIDEHMTIFFGTFTIVNVCLGLVTMALTWSIGLPNPLLWGVLAGTLNYVPYIGPAIVAVTLTLVGILTFPTLAAAFVAPLIFIAIVTVEGHFLTPALMGRRLELNPFAVFLMIAFCTWLWGPLGAFLAVPLLMAMNVSLGHVFGVTKPQLPE